MTAAMPIAGECDPRFEPVRRAFETNLAERGDIGSAVAVTVAGVPVVDLWGGWLDAARTRPWTRDAIVNVWSVGKAVTAIALLRQVERGLIDLDAPVARYWPEFAQAGKGDIPVHMLMSHRAGLPAVGKPLPPGYNLTNWDGMCTALAEQEPWWTPGERFGYHTNTFGFLLGELVRRTDGRSIGRFVREELAKPLGWTCSSASVRERTTAWPNGTRTCGPRAKRASGPGSKRTRRRSRGWSWRAYWLTATRPAGRGRT